MADERSNPYAPPGIAASKSTVAESAGETNVPKGVGGWLVVSLIGVVVVGCFCAAGLIRIVMNLDAWIGAVMQPDIFWFDAVRVLLIVVLFSMSFTAVWWMFLHDRRLPTLMIVYYTVHAVLFAIMAFTRSTPAGVSEAYQVGYVGGQWIWVARSVAWILYYRSSERVENTFTE